MRIASLFPAATDWVRALGAADHLVGCSHECETKGRGLSVLTRPSFDSAGDSASIDASVRKRLGQGLSLYDVDIDALREARPDVVLTQAQCEVCAATLPQLEALLGEWAGRRPRLVSIEPRTLKQVIDAGFRIASAIGRLDAAMRFIAEQEGSLHRMQQHLGLSPKGDDAAWPTVVCIEWLKPLMTAGHWTPDVIRQAGGRVQLSSPGEPSATIEWQALRAADPDVLLLFPCGFSIAETVRDLHYLTARQGWDQLSAVRNARVYVLDGSMYFNRPGPQLYRAIELVAYCLYGEHLPTSSVNPEAWELRSLSDVFESTPSRTPTPHSPG